MQILASGNCVDGSICGAGQDVATCRAGTTGQRKYTPQEAMHSPMFSSVYNVFAPGTHTVLVRANAYMGCGIGGLDGKCYSKAPVAFKAMSGGHRVCCSRARHACPAGWPWLTRAAAACKHVRPPAAAVYCPPPGGWPPSPTFPPEAPFEPLAPPYDPMDVLPCNYTLPKRALPAQA